jgi:hypothetical protein
MCGHVVGDFGWFYGDFFISTDAYRNHLCYTGKYILENTIFGVLLIDVYVWLVTFRYLSILKQS